MGKNPEKVDKRVIKTKASIRKAFQELIGEMDYSQITVSLLAKTAMINRKTFYLHYSSMEDIINEIENDILNQLTKDLKETGFTTPPQDFYRIFEGLNEIIQKDYEFYKKLFTRTSHFFFTEKLIEILKNFIVSEYSELLNVPEETIPLYAQYFASGIVTIYREWLYMEPQIPISEMAAIVSKVVYHGASIFSDTFADLAPKPEQ